MAPPDLPRHTLVWLKPGAPWITLAGSSTDRLQAWLAVGEAGRPAVVARRQGDEPADVLRLGVALPPSEGKQRLSLVAPPSSIARSRDALSLAEILAGGSSPAEWHDALHLLNLVIARTGLQPQVYGSFAWQALTGERYVGADSDIDLLWRPRSAVQIDALVVALTQWEGRTGRRADGEVLLPNGDAVCWREWAGSSPRVLVKSKFSVALRARPDVLAGFA